MADQKPKIRLTKISNNFTKTLTKIPIQKERLSNRRTLTLQIGASQSPTRPPKHQLPLQITEIQTIGETGSSNNYTQDFMKSTQHSAHQKSLFIAQKNENKLNTVSKEGQIQRNVTSQSRTNQNLIMSADLERAIQVSKAVIEQNFHNQGSSKDQQYFGVSEVACIYQTYEEREINRPRRQAVPNPALDEDMEKYKLKIEARFQESEVQQSYKMTRIETRVYPLRNQDHQLNSSNNPEQQITDLHKKQLSSQKQNSVMLRGSPYIKNKKNNQKDEQVIQPGDQSQLPLNMIAASITNIQQRGASRQDPRMNQIQSTGRLKEVSKITLDDYASTIAAQGLSSKAQRAQQFRNSSTKTLQQQQLKQQTLVIASSGTPKSHISSEQSSESVVKKNNYSLGKVFVHQKKAVALSQHKKTPTHSFLKTQVMLNHKTSEKSGLQNVTNMLLSQNNGSRAQRFQEKILGHSSMCQIQIKKVDQSDRNTLAKAHNYQQSTKGVKVKIVDFSQRELQQQTNQGDSRQPYQRSQSRLKNQSIEVKKMLTIARAQIPSTQRQFQVKEQKEQSESNKRAKSTMRGESQQTPNNQGQVQNNFKIVVNESIGVKKETEGVQSKGVFKRQFQLPQLSWNIPSKQELSHAQSSSNRMNVKDQINFQVYDGQQTQTNMKASESQLRNLEILTQKLTK